MGRVNSREQQAPPGRVIQGGLCGKGWSLGDASDEATGEHSSVCQPRLLTLISAIKTIACAQVVI